MAIDTLNVPKDNELNSKLESALSSGKPLRVVTGSGRVLIAFPADGFERMCEVIQSPQFTESLRRGISDFDSGRVKFVEKK